MHRALVRSLIYPLHERLRGRPTMRLLREFRATDRKTPAELEAWRIEKLRGLIDHARRQCPYYADVFAGADTLQHLGDLARFPTIDKVLIRAHREDMAARNYRSRLFQLATGGSSGQPLIFYTDKVREASQLAAKLRAREWWGIRVGDHQVDLWGSPIELSSQDRVRAFKDGLLNQWILSAFQLTDEAMAAYGEFLSRRRADFLYGYASVLARYARFLEGRGENLHHLSLKGAISTAELLLEPDREVIERVFGCPVINEYGCRDGGYIAQTCPAGGLHIAADTMIVEILSEDGKPLPTGEVGEVCVTNLWSFGMPLIRYRLGDTAARVAEPCECGRPQPLLARLGGRRTDTLVTPDGRRIHGLGAMYVLRVLPAVKSYQVIQEAPDHLRVLLVPEGQPAETDLEGPVRDGLAKLMGDGVRIEVERVEEIPVLPSGKMRAIWNRVQD